MDDCNIDILQRYLSGTLTPAEIEDCERHLLACDSCRKELAVLIRMLDENVPPDEALIVDSAEAVLPKRVPLPNPPVRVYLQPKTRWSVLPKWGFAAAACVIVLVAG